MRSEKMYWYAVGMGGNLGDVLESFATAMRKVHEEYGRVVSVSQIYRSRPLPTQDGIPQESYCNGVFIAESLLSPREFLMSLLKIEEYLGRDRKRSAFWGPRTIDLDIICASCGVVQEEDLKIPHRRMEERDFVVRPLLDLMPEWIHPIIGKPIRQLAEELPPSACFIESALDVGDRFQRFLEVV